MKRAVDGTTDLPLAAHCDRQFTRHAGLPPRYGWLPQLQRGEEPGRGAGAYHWLD